MNDSSRDRDGGDDKVADTRTNGRRSCSFTGCIKDNLLLILSLAGVGVGFVVGFLVRLAEPSEEAILWTGLPGELYMRMLKATILPLIISSVISGSASLDPKCNGRISAIALAYILVTNAVGAILALIVGIIIQPGSGQEISSDVTRPNTQNLQTQDIFADLIRNLFPDNLVAACFQQSQTKYTITERLVVTNMTGGFVNESVQVYTRSLGTNSGTNILGLIIASTVLGMAASKCKDIGQPFLKFFQSTCEIMIQVLHWIVWYTPVGVASLIAASIAKASEIDNTFKSLGMFVLTVTVGVAIHQLMFVQCMYFLFLRRNPLKFYFSCFRPMMTAFAPPSTAVAIPDMLVCLEGKNHVDKKVSRFVVPFAATLNRDGSCLFITLAAIYIGQTEGSLDAGRYLMIAILATAGSLAIPFVPSASIVTLLILLSSLNMSPANIGLIMAVEWYTDRIRTTSNTLSCCLCTVVTYQLSKRWLTSTEVSMLKVRDIDITLKDEDSNVNTKL
ncbi:excitatory amino acid transporter-like [Gigantopelta aegis]|uniref:excitatory amino acid transporter-like n=1 Tax=Gigantopelta aegis TaxID=1735272 RepID=UPI001B888445|nr:excitatory amino acid transporter-like [Gigantopelta aegis]